MADNAPHTNCVGNGTGSSGVTARGLIDYLSSHEPPLLLLENVSDLCEPHQAANLQAPSVFSLRTFVLGRWAHSSLDMPHYFPSSVFVVLEKRFPLFRLFVFEELLRGIAGAGYLAGYKVINAKSSGLPQNRRRMYLLGFHCAQLAMEPDEAAGRIAGALRIIQRMEAAEFPLLDLGLFFKTADGVTRCYKAQFVYVMLSLY